MRHKGLMILFIGFLVTAFRAFGEDSPLSLGDLEAYRIALSSKSDSMAPMVSFRDLWNRPADYAGKPVTVEGRVSRVFRQGSFGEFPPLVEAWVVSPAGDPFCVVFPQPEGRQTHGVGTTIRFSGTFLRRIKYQGGDVERLAPLIVGPRAPEAPVSPEEDLGNGWSSTDWMMAVGASLVVGLILAGRHFNRPHVGQQNHEPPPSFVDAKPEEEGNFP